MFYYVAAYYTQSATIGQLYKVRQKRMECVSSFRDYFALLINNNNSYQKYIIEYD